ncbi:hypothetical protein WK18_25565 [Burkholderia ubonensis]|nr:hypothetical protein WK18_25565 [Burkholderia ubonensis]KVT05260.1 hypothetical protein WK46_12840 [Burkholderia ubonensis]KVT16120.1 hypothetical protein WK47_29700 [Burkholderia ubonensis]KVT33082.1 hypothetical protein WK50_04330 [Burkholderia ubonensis]KWB72156.1 hypothetical protein WL41_21065 [Burkholderia ubonensis]
MFPRQFRSHIGKRNIQCFCEDIQRLPVCLSAILSLVMQWRETIGTGGGITTEQGFANLTLGWQAVPPFPAIARKQQKPHGQIRGRLQHDFDQGKQIVLACLGVINDDKKWLLEGSQGVPACC